MSFSFNNIHLFFFLSFSLLTTSQSSQLPSIGVTYTHSRNPQRVISTLQSLKISHVRLPKSDPQLIRSFSYSGISLLLSIPNSLIPQISSNQSKALQWLNYHIVPYYPRTRISAISVGNNTLDSSPQLSNCLLPAIRNVYKALRELGINKISVSTTFSFISVITTAFPPSSAEFQESVADSLMKPLLDFLSTTKSPFFINLYPYNMYRSNFEIPIGYALFQEQPFNFQDDRTTGLRYRNLFDVMVDAVLTAMAVAGYEDVPLIVTETGWPSNGGEKMGESKMYAEMYYKGLIRHLRSGLGTPLQRDGVAETYIFELLDDEGSSDSKDHWGILYPNMTQKYKLNFSESARADDEGLVVVWFCLVVLILFFQCQ